MAAELKVDHKTVKRVRNDESWLHAVAKEFGMSPHTLHGWRKKGWLLARQLSGRGGPWAVWANEREWARLRALKNVPVALVELRAAEAVANAFTAWIKTSVRDRPRIQ